MLLTDKPCISPGTRIEEWYRIAQLYRRLLLDCLTTMVVVLTADEILQMGLALLGVNQKPRWEGLKQNGYSDLRLDMDERKHKTMKPQQLCQSRKEYYDIYPLTVYKIVSNRAASDRDDAP